MGDAIAFLDSVSLCLQLISRPKEERYKPLKVFLDVLAVIAQGSALVYWPVMFYMETGEDYEPVYTIPISLLLMSFTFWFNYIDETNISRKRRFKYDTTLSRSTIFRTKVYR